MLRESLQKISNETMININIRDPLYHRGASQVALVVKNLPPNAGDIKEVDSIPESGRSPGEGYGSPFQCYCLENPVEKEPGGIWSIGSQRVRHD